MALLEAALTEPPYPARRRERHVQEVAAAWRRDVVDQAAATGRSPRRRPGAVGRPGWARRRPSRRPLHRRRRRGVAAHTPQPGEGSPPGAAR
ncbi:hypothetical protein QTQ03_05815 [Micromonospora sp. WMMA1363]|uniref:hypothetical protein n=1 Tax=Micromonospora sp. WMMA1363 TaxID=3053985 RepID=UPI00259CF90E|nr:hypothetical protein [Micromonospora sp. WMMA1363]MDM4719136.1 hypothetical protein [Micromonospora sp. WMMA1363]